MGHFSHFPQASNAFLPTQGTIPAIHIWGSKGGAFVIALSSGGSQTWVQILNLILTNYVTLNKHLMLSELCCPIYKVRRMVLHRWL